MWSSKIFPQLMLIGTSVSSLVDMRLQCVWPLKKWHPKCNLHYLRLVFCSATIHQWDDLSSSLKINQSGILEPHYKWAASCYTWLWDIESISCWGCHLTIVILQELAARSCLLLWFSKQTQRLTLLYQAKKNALGNGRVNLLYEGLSYP